MHGTPAEAARREERGERAGKTIGETGLVGYRCSQFLPNLVYGAPLSSTNSSNNHRGEKRQVERRTMYGLCV